MNWKKAIGYGVLLWVLMFVIVSVFIAYDLHDIFWMQIIEALIAGLISLMLAGRLQLSKAGEAFAYGLLWVVVGLVLDLFITMKFAPDFFTTWTVWLAYILVLLAPLLKIKKPTII